MRSLVADFKKRVEVEKDLRGITAKHYFSVIKNYFHPNVAADFAAAISRASSGDAEPL